MLADYRELAELREGNFIVLETTDYGRLKSTLEDLIIRGYINDLKVDNGYIYTTDESFDYLIKNPGIKIDHSYVLKARELNIPVINEVFKTNYKGTDTINF